MTKSSGQCSLSVYKEDVKIRQDRGKLELLGAVGEAVLSDVHFG